MTIKLPLTLALSTGLLLTGCAETKTFGTNVVQTAGSVVNAAVSGTINGIKQGMAEASGSSNNPSQANKLPADDMVYLFGWMEDGCIGDSGQPYIQILNHYKDVTDTLIRYRGMVPAGEPNYESTPRSQWPAKYRNAIKHVTPVRDTELTDAYMITFNDNVKYRGQPLQAHIFHFNDGSEGSAYELKFASNANVAAIWPNFYTREFDPYWGDGVSTYTRGATLKPQSNIIHCVGD